MVFKRAVILFLFISQACFGQYYYPLAGMMANSVNPVFTSSLVSAYNADGDANDFTGNANGTLTNGATATGTPKVGAYSFSLDGINDYVDCGTNKWNTTDQLTISAWINPSSLSGERYIVQNFNYNGSVFSGWALEIYLNKIYYSWGTAATQAVSASNVSTGTYTHIVVTHDATANEIKFYINGVLDATRTSAVAHSNTLTNKSRIGLESINAGDFNFWAGNIDALQIWNRKLSSTDITTLYNSGNGLQP